MTTPNMAPEIIDALTSFYESDEPILIDCLVYLASNNVISLAAQAEKILEDKDRCPSCGEEFKYYSYKVPHPELEGCPYETIVDKYCQYCDDRIQTDKLYRGINSD